MTAKKEAAAVVVPHPHTADHRKQSLYFPEDMLSEIETQARRQDRSLSWIVQQAWKIARTQLRKVPSANDLVRRQD